MPAQGKNLLSFLAIVITFRQVSVSRASSTIALFTLYRQIFDKLKLGYMRSKPWIKGQIEGKSCKHSTFLT